MPINITMPALSPTMTDGTLARWLKKEGDAVAPGDVIAEIETDKATMEVEAVDEGVLAKILVPEGTENVPVNDVIAVLAEEGESVDDIPPSSLRANEENEAIQSRSEAEIQNGLPRRASAPRNDGGERIKSSPLARRIAKDKGIDLASVKGSGPRGRIVKADVVGAPKAAVEPAEKQPSAPVFGDSEFTEIPHSNIRKVVARRLSESKQTVPHFYLTVDCRIDNLLALRKELNDQASGAYKLSVNDFVIKCAAMALKSYPAANVSWTDTAMRQYKHADISVAVATPNGLITPIIRRAEEKGLRQISEEMKDLAARARDGKLKLEEFQGGTFSISNLGMFGVKDFAAIINPPQSCILAVGAGIEQPVAVNGKLEIGTVMSVTLSTDHRSVDGAVGAEWLQHFKRYIETPASMLV